MKNLVFPRIFLHCVALGFIVSGLLLSPRSPVRARAGVPASKQHHKVISRRRRRPIDRWCCFSFPNRTHFIGLRFGPIKEQTPFRFRQTAKTALCWLLLPFPNRTRSAGLRFTFFTTRRASTICACPPSHILSVSHFYFLKNATTTAPGPAWVPITLPTVV